MCGWFYLYSVKYLKCPVETYSKSLLPPDLAWALESNAIQDVRVYWSTISVDVPGSESVSLVKRDAPAELDKIAKYFQDLVDNLKNVEGPELANKAK